MPWKGETDPYKIWLSEIILQQTRVEQGLKYYENFIKAYPNIEALAAAPQDAVFKLWEGLGYYSRCRNLMAAAQFIAEKKGGRFPNTYESILELKGVGPYTAAAIASFAFDLPHAVLDGNVYRVLSRIYSDETPTDSTSGKKRFTQLAAATLSTSQPGAYNQAIMDFGATICKPVPLCEGCFFQKHCLAFQEGRQRELPVKEKKTRIRERWFHYFLIEKEGKILVQQRQAKDIWQGLYEFPLIETEGPATLRSMREKAAQLFKITEASNLKILSTTTQKLSHQTVHFTFYESSWPSVEVGKGMKWMGKKAIGTRAFPRTLQQFLQVHH